MIISENMPWNIWLVRYWLECNENLPAKDMAAVANVIRQTKGVLQDMSEEQTEEQ